MSENNYIKILQKTIFIIGLFLIYSATVFSQNADAQLALKYYQNGEFDKAAVIYEKLYQESGYKNNRDYYLRCLLQLKDYDTAEKFLNRELKRNKTDFYLGIDLGMVYFSTNKINDAKSEFDKVINLVKTNRNNVYGAASAFMSYRQFEYAEKVYLAGAKSLNADFSMELGNLYYMQRDYERMMREYLNHLEKNSQAMPTIQSRLQFAMASDIDESIDGIIETLLLEKIQQNPQNASFNKLLIWQYTQTGRYRVALNQLIAVDRRTKTGDVDILEFGVLLYENIQYELALEAFDYLMTKGKDHRIYNQAYIEYLNVLYTKTTEQLEPSNEDLTKLEQMLEESLNIILRKESFKIVYALVNIKAFYLNKYDEAVALLNNSISEKRFLPEQDLVLKLLLGDIYFLNNNPWDAVLIYAQVENSSREAPVGHEARFKKAKLAYYTGQFKWAQAQLDVLKASTSKLISNDAMELSLFISENYNLDTTETTMQIFARADFYTFSKQYNRAFLSLDTIINNYSSHSLVDDALYRKGLIYEETGNYHKASEYFKIVAETYHYDILADNALFKYGLVQEKLRNIDLAKDAYLKLIMDYPGSIFTVEARKNLRRLESATQ